MKAVSLLLAISLVYNSAVLADQAAPASGTTQLQTQETRQAAKIKSQAQNRGTGKKSRVRVKLVNGTEVTGYISKLEETSFIVTDQKTGQTTNVPYAHVQKVRGAGGLLALCFLHEQLPVQIDLLLACPIPRFGGFSVIRH